MSIHRQNAKRDSVEPEIFAAVRGVGGQAYALSGEGIPDAILTFRGQTFLAEIKSIKGKLTPAQIILHAEWKGEPILILRSAEQALREIGATD